MRTHTAPTIDQALRGVGKSKAALAAHLGLSRTAVSRLVNHGTWPSTCDAGHLREQVRGFLVDAGAAHMPPELDTPAPADAPAPTPNPNPEEALQMLLRKHTLTRAARQHFKLARDPFGDELHGEDDVFLTPDIRYVRSAMRQCARHGGMLAVIAESGGGKSTLRMDLIDWINSAGEPITVIEPYVLGMEDTDRKGKTLRSVDITGAVIRAVAPGAPLRASQQDRSAQMHTILRESAKVGRRHVLVIEEAHCLAIPTLKHLKRFYELQDGFRRLLSIVLIGQTELELKLSEHNPEVREVVQRCEVVTLPPLDTHVEAYLRHRLQRAELDFGALFAPDAVDEIRNQLRISATEVVRGQRQVRQRSLCYPLAVNNLATAALNQAATIGAPLVNAQLVAAAARAQQ